MAALVAQAMYANIIPKQHKVVSQNCYAEWVISQVSRDAGNVPVVNKHAEFLSSGGLKVCLDINM
jgi:hypothetical protein